MSNSRKPLSSSRRLFSKLQVLPLGHHDAGTNNSACIQVVLTNSSSGSKMPVTFLLIWLTGVRRVCLIVVLLKLMLLPLTWRCSIKYFTNPENKSLMKHFCCENITVSIFHLCIFNFLERMNERREKSSKRYLPCNSNFFPASTCKTKIIFIKKRMYFDAPA